MSRTILLAAFSLLWAGCAEEEPAGPAPATPVPVAEEEPECAPLQVSVDGTSMTVSHGLAMDSEQGVVVHLFNDESVTCENILGGFWPSPRGQVHLSIRQHEGTGYAATDSRNTMAEVRSLGSVGELGSVVSLCLDEEVTFGRRVGKPPVVMSGRFDGTFCGHAP